MATTTYQAAISRDKGRVGVVDLPYPRFRDDDIIIRNLMAGVCGTDIVAYKYGDLRSVWIDAEFGHEVVSEVLEIGKNVKGPQVGRHVFPNQGNVRRDRHCGARLAAGLRRRELQRLPVCRLNVAVDNFALLASRNASLAVLGVHNEPVPMNLKLQLAYPLRRQPTDRSGSNRGAGDDEVGPL